MTKNGYVNRVIREIHCVKPHKKQIAKDLIADIDGAIESGETWEQIQIRLGDPSELAREFNENLTQEERVEPVKPDIRLFVLVAVLLLVTTMGAIVFNNYRSKEAGSAKATATSTPTVVPTSTAQVASGFVFDEAKVKNLAKEIVSSFNKNEYEKIWNQSDSIMKSKMSVEALKKAKDTYLSATVAGNFVTILSEKATLIKQEGDTQSYAVVVVNAQYEKRTVIYTISFNETMELSGFYFK